jgi:LCP family protein required for cell wall assembly
LNKKNKGKNTGNSVNDRRKSSIDAYNQEEGIIGEVTISIGNHEENLSKKEKKKFEKKQKNLEKQARKSRKGKKKHKVLKIILSLFLIGFLIYAGLFLKRWSENGWTFGGFVATILGHDANTLANLPKLNILVVGQSQNLTDTILVCQYDPKVQQVSMLSIPRDTFIGRNKNRAGGMDKINSLYQIDPDKLLKKVNEITGLNIQYYVKVDTKGLRELVDSVGGIYFDVPMDMDYDDPTQDLHIHLKKGYQLLDGDKAEQVVRFRHNNDGSSYPKEYGDQDLGRMKTQRSFITEVIKQVVRRENITKVDDYIKIASNHVETNFNLWALKDYAPYAIDFKTENIKSSTLPGAPEKCNSLWFFVYNKKKTDELVTEMFKSEINAEYTKNSQIKISILNGTDDDMNLENLKSLLKEYGYTISSTGKTSPTQNTTIINRTSQTDDTCNKLKDKVGVGMVSNSTKNNSDVDFTIIIGSDY